MASDLGAAPRRDSFLFNGLHLETFAYASCGTHSSWEPLIDCRQSTHAPVAVASSVAVLALLQRLPRCPLRRVPGCRLPSGARRAGGRVLHFRGVEGRSPTALIVARQLKIESLVRHADCDAADAGPGVEVRAKDTESPVSGRKPGETECCSQELAALVAHGLLDDLVRSYQHRLRNCHAQSFGGFQVDPEGEAPGLLHGQISRLRPLEDLVD